MATDPKARSASNAGTTADGRQSEAPPQGELPEQLVKEEAEQNARNQDTKQSPKDPTKENPDA